MYKERCPCCDTIFPFLGPKMKIIDAHTFRSRVEYECPACMHRLERRLSKGERALLFVGAVALFVASVLSILMHMSVLQNQANPIVMALYIVSALVGIIEIRNELVRQRFYVGSAA